jgi:hypothetical protein
VADITVGHAHRKKDVQSLHLTISDADLLAAIDRMVLDSRETGFWAAEIRNVKLRR